MLGLHLALVTPHMEFTISIEQRQINFMTLNTKFGVDSILIEHIFSHTLICNFETRLKTLNYATSQNTWYETITLICFVYTTPWPHKILVLMRRLQVKPYSASIPWRTNVHIRSCPSSDIKGATLRAGLHYGGEVHRS